LWILTAKASIAIAPTMPLPQEGDLILVEGNSLVSRQTTLFSNDLEAQLWEAAAKYGLDYEFFKAIINCECNLKKDHEKCLGDGGLAFGRAQFHKSTFQANCDGDYYSERDQIFCAAKMISEGKGFHWSCFKALTDLF
jgi:hypothetical protein